MPGMSNPSSKPNSGAVKPIDLQLLMIYPFNVSHYSFILR